MTEATGGLEVADWDGDGELDILLCSLGNNVSVRQLKRSSPDLLVEPWHCLECCGEFHDLESSSLILNPES